MQVVACSILSCPRLSATLIGEQEDTIGPLVLCSHMPETMESSIEHRLLS